MFTTVVSDVVARYHRLLGNDVYFLTGTDEHGSKAEKAARELGISPREMADRIALPFENLWKHLNISFSDFIRTTEPRHYESVSELWRRCKQNGDIYLGEYEGWYCTSDEAFWTEGQLIDGKCPDCGRAVERIKEESYFFRLSKYQEPLLKFYRENPTFIYPRTRFNEVISFVESGLRDISVSRLRLKWGIPVPDDPRHVIYVWFDALTNYITGVGFPSNQELFKRYWPATLHVIGKDIVRFHAVYWPAFLLSGGVELPKQLMVHGWWMKDDTKISKSRGNTVDPEALIKTFGVDGSRYFLTREAPIESDSSYDFDSILRRVNSDLANDLGNLVSRSLTMVHRYNDGVVPQAQSGSAPFQSLLENITNNLELAVSEFAFPRLLADIWNVVNAMNRYIVDEQPWTLAKDPSKKQKLNNVLYNTSEGLRFIGGLIAPVIPSSADTLWNQLGLDKAASNCTMDDLRWGQLQPGTKLREVVPLFPRIELKGDEAVEDQQQHSKTVEMPKPEPQERISIEDFTKTGLRVAEVKAAEKVEGSKKLLKITVDLGNEVRTVVAGIADAYAPEDLVGKQVVIVTNLKPAKLMGVESNGMVLAASVDGKPVLVSLSAPVPNGTIVK
jgi:methionyl-tRNA synthetase